MLILGHRGYHKHCPENTLEAFSKALELGVDGIETDVRVTADGVPILFHDSVVRSATDEGANAVAVAEVTHKAIQERVGFSVPTLEEALRTWPNIFWNLEIKVPEALPYVEKALLQNAVPQVLVTSFHHPVIAQLAARSSIECGILIAHNPVRAISLINGFEGSRTMTTIVWDIQTLSLEAVMAMRAFGYKNFTYGFATLRESQSLEKFELDGVITDEPGYFSLRH